MARPTPCARRVYEVLAQPYVIGGAIVAVPAVVACAVADEVTEDLLGTRLLDHTRTALQI